jgi:predicted enzyme related to lactoylglutathione lyase
VHLPVHPIWFWLVALAPCFVLLALWAAANTLKVSLKQAARWLWAGYFLLFIPYFLVDWMNGPKTLRVVIRTGFWTCWSAAIWIKSQSMFETLRAPGGKWYLPWNGVAFTVPAGTRIVVRSIDSVSPWYVEKLGLREFGGSNLGESGTATFRFKEDGNPLVLASGMGFGAGTTPMLFTKKIGRMRDVLTARGVNVGTIARDRQGVRYFQIHDPEGNEIEVVEEH